MNNYLYGSQGTYVERNCTRLFWSNQMINIVIKKGNEDVNMDVLVNMCDMLLNEAQTQRKDEKSVIVKSEVARKFVQTRDSKTNDEEKV